MLSLLRVVLLVVLCRELQAQDHNTRVNRQDQKMKCYNDISDPIRCVPEFVNAAFLRIVTSSNTCGTPKSTFCVQTLSSGQRKECQICDSQSKSLSHPSIYITDIKDDKNFSWWQSDTLYTMEQNKIYDRYTGRSPVVLHLDLGKTFEVVSIRLRFHSLRPESMAIFKRTTSDMNAQWIPYQYYSRSCRGTYGVEPDGIILRDNLQSALCTAKYSQLVPLSGGEVLFRTLANRPGRDEIESLPALQDWIRAYSLRFNLTRLNTFGDEIFGDPNVYRSYYYAIIDITVVGKCDCNGHASKCVPHDNGVGGRQAPLVCVCEHFTAGVDCEKCLPFYNNKPWAKATSRNAHPCEVCDCNGLADTCEFDKAQYERTGGRGGRCIGCRNNTGGPYCDRCKDNFYRENENEQCKPCNCNPVGSNILQCHTDGRCYCKSGVTGDKCDRCLPNHYGFSQDGCSPCQCSRLGTRPDNFQCDENGQCTCKKNVVGKNCDKCRPGYFALEVDNPYGCRACFCYGHSYDCKSADGFSSVNLTSVFRFGYEEWTALNGKGEDVTRQFATWDQQQQNVRVTSINQDSIYLSAPVTYLNKKRSSYSRILAFNFKVADTANMQFMQDDIILISKSGLKISTSLTAQGNPVPTRSFQRYQYRLHEHPSYDWLPKLSGFDFQRLLDDIIEMKIRMTYSDQGTGFIDDVSLEFAQSGENAVDVVNWVEQCSCPPPHVGLSCEDCSDAYKYETVNGSSYDRCVRCECNNHADKCDPDTGKCVCQDNTDGDNCQKCKDGYYGNPTSGTKDDCKPCPCAFGNTCVQLGLKVTCTDCPEGHQGDLCDECIDGFYGDPSGSRGPKTRCRKCDCNGNIDTNAVSNCDPKTGDCLKCIYNSRNGPQKQCELCKVGFYGEATTYPKPGCVACDCHENGTFVSFTTDTSQPLPCNQEGQCICRVNVVGKKCDRCISEHWNINSKTGCEPCNCDKVGSLSNDCNMDSGQCVCKPGVGGRKCDRCLPDHYQFSQDGCKACNCSREGSLGVTCDENGRCICRPGVLGIKCDECGENRFNLSAGCTRCPPCFDELKLRVDKLRGILKSLNQSNPSGGDSQTNPDKAFQSDLNSVREQLLKLLDRAEDTSVNDKELMKRLDALNITLVLIESKLNDAEGKAKESDTHSAKAITEINVADNSIERSWELVKQLNISTEETADILKKIYNSMKSWSTSTVNLRERTKEVRDLASNQWKEVNDLQKIANDSLTSSKEAGKNTEKAEKLQNDTIEQITLLDNDINDLRTLGNLARTNASEAKNFAEETNKDASKLLKKGQTALEEIDVNKTKADASETTKEAKDVQDEAKRLANQKTEFGDFDRSGLEHRKTVLYTAENATSDLLKKAQEANKTAHFAIANGTKTIEEARKTVDILENFNKRVNESRAKAEKAKEDISEIERLIDSANNKTDKSRDEVGNAADDVKQAEVLAKNALKLSTDTAKKAQELKERAGNLTIPDDSVYDESIKAEKNLGSYEDQANKDEKVVKTATKMANESKETAESVMESIVDARNGIVELSSLISDLPDLDYAKLEELENRTKQHVELDGYYEVEVNEIRLKEKKILEDIKRYTIDLSELEKVLADIERNRKILPRKCTKDKQIAEG